MIWPEAAVPYLIERSPEVAAYLTRAVPPGGLLLTGAVRAEPVDGAVERIYNGLSALDETGTRLATADKYHLVPFGEYVPLRGMFPFLAKLTPGELDFTPARAPHRAAAGSAALLATDLLRGDLRRRRGRSRRPGRLAAQSHQ